MPYNINGVWIKPEPSIERLEDGLIRVKTPYNPNFIAALRQHIHWSQLTWNRIEKAWVIPADLEDLVIGLLHRYF